MLINAALAWSITLLALASGMAGFACKTGIKRIKRKDLELF
jgi:hypothetical protein